MCFTLFCFFVLIVGTQVFFSTFYIFAFLLFCIFVFFIFLYICTFLFLYFCFLCTIYPFVLFELFVLLYFDIWSIWTSMQNLKSVAQKMAELWVLCTFVLLYFFKNFIYVCTLLRQPIQISMKNMEPLAQKMSVLCSI